MINPASFFSFPVQEKSEDYEGETEIQQYAGFGNRRHDFISHEYSRTQRKHDYCSDYGGLSHTVITLVMRYVLAFFRLRDFVLRLSSRVSLARFSKIDFQFLI